MQLMLKSWVTRIRRYSNWIIAGILLLSLIPILYCSMYNYASADDFAKSYSVHRVLLAGGGLMAAIVESVRAAVDQWVTIEGTWSSNFFLSFQPSIWGEHAYAITVPLCILYAAVGSMYLFHEILVVWCGMTRRACWFLFWCQMFLFLQYLPFIRGGMFWYTGMAHYIMPMCLALLMIAWMLKWYRTGRKRYYVYMLLDAIYIGGSHYQHILIVLLAFVTGWILMALARRAGRTGQNQIARVSKSSQDTTGAADGSVQKAADSGVAENPVCGVIENRIHLLWIPIVIVLIGLYICVISPGNNVRGGDTFGLHISSILLMPVSCAVDGARHAAEYIANAPLIIVYAIILWFAGQHAMPAGEPKGLRKVPAILIVIYLFLLYASTEAPAIYAADNPEGISGAYYDTVYQSLLLVMTIGIPMIASRVPERFRLGWKPVTVVCLVLMVLFLKPSVKNSSTYLCYDFIHSGRLEDFVIQMEERLEILNDPSLDDVYVPEMNPEQGPFMHLQLSQDATNYTNRSTAWFYNKSSVTAVPREQYYKEYAAMQGHDIPEAYRDLYSMD